MYPQLYHHWFPPARSREGLLRTRKGTKETYRLRGARMGHWGVWGYALARVRVIEDGGVIGMGNGVTFFLLLFQLTNFNIKPRIAEITEECPKVMKCLARPDPTSNLSSPRMNAPMRASTKATKQIPRKVSILPFDIDAAIKLIIPTKIPISISIASAAFPVVFWKLYIMLYPKTF